MHWLLSLHAHLVFLVHLCFLIFNLLNSLLLFLVSKPSDPLALLPGTDSNLTLRVFELSYAFLHSIAPVALILFSIGPCVNSKAFLLIILVIALISPAIWPLVEALSIELAVFVQPYILPLIGGNKDTIAAHFIILPLTLIGRAIWPNITTLTVLFTFFESSFINRIVTQFFSSLTMLHVI